MFTLSYIRLSRLDTRYILRHFSQGRQQFVTSCLFFFFFFFFLHTKRFWQGSSTLKGKNLLSIGSKVFFLLD